MEIKSLSVNFFYWKSRFLIAQVIKNRKSSTFNTLCFKAFKYTPYHLVKTFTVNRGEFFSGYANIENTLNIDVYSP